jgi:glycine oxidase
MGVTLRAGCATHGFIRLGERITGAKTSAGPLSAGKFLIAAGAWSENLLDPFGCRPGIQPIRGQIALLHTGVPILRSILMMGKRYLVPRPDGRVLIGSTEEAVGFDKRTTAQGIGELLLLAAKLVPALSQATVERCWAGLRPGSPDGRPFIGPVPGVQNLYVSAGHFRSGIQLSVASALVLKELLLEQPLTVSVEAFRLGR